MCEEVWKEDRYCLSGEQIARIRKETGMQKLIRMVSGIDALYGIYLKLIHNKGIHWGWVEKQRKLRERAYQIEQEHAHELTSPEEIAKITDKIRKALT